MSKLKTCPFCGNKAKFSFSRDGEVANVRCVSWGSGCMGAGPNEYTREKAAEGWNRRAIEAAVPANKFEVE